MRVGAGVPQVAVTVECLCARVFWVVVCCALPIHSELYANSGAAGGKKWFVPLTGAGHNDLVHTAGGEYFRAVRVVISTVSSL